MSLEVWLIERALEIWRRCEPDPWASPDLCAAAYAVVVSLSARGAVVRRRFWRLYKGPGREALARGARAFMPNIGDYIPKTLLLRIALRYIAKHVL